MTDRELMQQALGYMESVGQMDMHPEEWAIAVALRERLAQPEQEPVAWRYRMPVEDGHWVWNYATYIDDPKDQRCEPLYTTPPQPEQNQFNPDWDAMAVMVEEQQRMAKRIAELEAQQEPVAWADECRIELVNAIHFLASDYENALGVFRNDLEARQKAEGDIAHARKVASRWNWNGTTQPQRKPLTDEEIDAICKEFMDWDYEQNSYRLAARAIEAAHGIKGEA